MTILQPAIWNTTASMVALSLLTAKNGWTNSKLMSIKLMFMMFLENATQALQALTISSNSMEANSLDLKLLEMTINLLKNTSLLKTTLHSCTPTRNIQLTKD